MALIGRIFVLIFAVMLSSIAAALVIASGLASTQWHSLSGDAAGQAGYWVLVFFTSGLIGAAGLLPLLIVIAIAEAVKIRAAFVYAAGGAVLLLLGYYGSGFSGRDEESIDRPPPLISREAEITAAAGIVFGLVYWAIAGRKAGAWRER